MQCLNLGKETVSVHAGKRAESTGVVNAVESSSAFRYIDENDQPYPRYFNTPNQQILIEQFASLKVPPQAGVCVRHGRDQHDAASVLKRGDRFILWGKRYIHRAFLWSANASANRSESAFASLHRPQRREPVGR